MSQTHDEQTSPKAEAVAILTTDARTADIAAEAMDALRDHNSPPSLFVRSQRLYEVKEDETGAPRLSALSGQGLTACLERAATWRTRRPNDGNKIGPVPKHVVEYVAQLSPWQPHLPTLRSFALTPVLIHDELGFRLLESAGYDGRSSVYVAEAKIEPWKGSGAEAAAWIGQELFGDFPFADQADRCHALAALITPFVRPGIDGTIPLFLFDGSSQGSGKSKLAGLCLFPGFGKVAVTSLPKEEDKIRVQITSWLLSASVAVVIDNVKGKVESPALEAVITSRIWEDRVYGTQTNVRLENTPVWVLSANNARFSPDLAQRSVRIRLVPLEEDPSLRENFRHADIDRWAEENRPRLIGAALAMIRTWIDAECPPSTARHGRHPAWSRVVGGILTANGVEGFLTNLASMKEDQDIETPLWRTFYEAWYREKGPEPLTSKTIAETWGEEEWFQSLLGEHSGTQTRRIGALLRAKKEKVYSDLQLKAGTQKMGDSRWMLQPVAGGRHRAPGAFDDPTPATPGAIPYDDANYDPMSDIEDMEL